MAVDERARHDLFGRLEQVLGPEHAVALMEHLPPVGWADVATKHDLGALEQRIDDQVALLRTEMLAMKHELLAAMRVEINAALVTQTRMMLFALVAAITSVGTLVLAAARL
jgi:hypothetical protein